jgi:hypothetical protein
MTYTLVGRNSAENNPGGTGYTVPSTLSNAAAIAANDFGAFVINTTETANAITLAGWTPIAANSGQNNGGSARVFYRQMTGTESAGWALTCGSAFGTTYDFAIFRNIDPVTPLQVTPTNTNDVSNVWDAGTSTATGAAVAVLVLSNFSITGTVATAPTPSPATTLVSNGAGNSLRQFNNFIYAADVSSGALHYTGTWSQTGDILAAVLLLNPAAGGGGGVSDDPTSAAQRQLRTNAIYRMSPENQAVAQRKLREQKRAHAFGVNACL